jgi:hypothetical protein
VSRSTLALAIALSLVPVGASSASHAPILAPPATDPPTTDGPAPSSPAVARLACEGPDVHPWVTERRDRTLRYDGVVHFAVERFGPPMACDGAVTTEFDGVPYGRVVLTFEGGIEYQVETMPIETSVRALRAAGGFGDVAAVEELLRAEAADIGFDIDWSSPEETVEGTMVTRRYRDPEPGLNASVSFVYHDEVLIEARLSMAL